MTKCDSPPHPLSPSPSHPAARRWWILGLIVLAVVPRVLMARQLPAPCDDGYYYLWVAQMWEQGRDQTALCYLNINVYPLVLVGLHQAGLDWITAAKLWGVIVSCLTVPAVYWLVRQLFDDRVAVAGCLLFAVHPDLIELSIEPIREPTFWFLFVLALALLHRAAHGSQRSAGGSLRPEVSSRQSRRRSTQSAIRDPRSPIVPSPLTPHHSPPSPLTLSPPHTLTSSLLWAVAAGIVAALAIHTRTEGWALLVPMLLWMLWLGPRSLSIARRCMRLGLAAAMIPAFVLFVNLTLLNDQPHWEWGRFTPLRNFVEWLRNDVSPEKPGLAVSGGDQPSEVIGWTSEVGNQRPEVSGRWSRYHSTQSAIRNPQSTIDASLRTPRPAAPPVPETATPGRVARPDRREGRGESRAAAEHALRKTSGRATPPDKLGRLMHFVGTWGQSFEYVNLCLMLFGLLACRGRLLDRSCLPMTLICGGLLLAVWVRYEQIGTMNSRYFLSAYFVALPTAAAGAVALFSAINRVSARVVSGEWWKHHRTQSAIGNPQSASDTARPHPLGFVLSCVVAAGVTAMFWIDALGTRHPTRLAQAELGTWLRETYGPFQRVEADGRSARVAFYARGNLPALSYYDAQDGPTPPPADAVIVHLPTDARFLRRVERLGLVSTPVSELPENARSYRVFVHAHRLARRRIAVAPAAPRR